MRSESDFLEHFQTTAGRLSEIAKFVRAVGQERIAGMSDEELRRLWDVDVQENPAAYGLNGGSFTGLSYRGRGEDLEPFHKDAGLGRGYALTLSGIEMLRWLASESGPVSEDSREAIRNRINTVARIVESSNELRLEEKRDLLGYLGAANAVLDMAQPDRALALDILNAVKRYASSAGAKFLEAEVSELLRWLLDIWPF